MSETPRTDAKEKETEHRSDEEHAHYGWKFARTLERELAAVTREHNRLVREMDVAMNGEEGAAPQASLCDLVSQAGEMRKKLDAVTRERDASDALLYDMCNVLSSGCEDEKARSHMEWAEYILAERDALRAGVERLRAALGCYIGEGPRHRFVGMCPDFLSDWDARDPECEACALLSAALQESTL